MKNNKCLNCGAPTDKNYCSNCGQKTDTHRITLKHFFLHDLLHGIWHLEKGILFTIKETFVRPGQAALDYIEGKRIRYYNVFYLALLVIGLNLLLSHLYKSVHPLEEVTQDNTMQVTQFFKNNLKTLLLSIVPVFGGVALLVFKRMQRNFAEHLIIGGITLLGILMLSVVFSFVNFIEGFESVPLWMGVFEVLAFSMMLLFPAWVYYNAARTHYSLLGFLWRILVFYILVLLILNLLLALIITNLTNGGNQIYINL